MNIHPHNFVAMGLVWRELGLTCVFSPLLKTLPQPLQSPCLVCQEWREFFFFFLCFLTFDFPALLLSLFLSFSLSLVLFQFCSRKNSQNKPMAAYPNTHTHALSVSQNSITKVCFVWLFSRHTHTRTHLCGDSYLFVVVCWMLASLPPIFCSCPLPPPSLSLYLFLSPTTRFPKARQHSIPLSSALHSRHLSLHSRGLHCSLQADKVASSFSSRALVRPLCPPLLPSFCDPICSATCQLHLP